MKKNTFKTAFTLVELIIATVLVVIVFLGIFSISSVLSNNNQDYGQKYLVKSETQTTLNHILNDASQAIGTATTDVSNNLIDQGILLGADLGDPNSFCIRQNTTGVDVWLCYTFYPSPIYQIKYCKETYTPGANPRGAASCATSANIIPGSGPTFLGTAYSMTPQFSATGQLLFSMTIQNCLNNSAQSCNAGATPGTSSDPANNPEVQLSGSVIPTQESM